MSMMGTVFLLKADICGSTKLPYLDIIQSVVVQNFSSQEINVVEYLFCAGFDWNLIFKWDYMSQTEIGQRKNNPTAPIR